MRRQTALRTAMLVQDCGYSEGLQRQSIVADQRFVDREGKCGAQCLWQECLDPAKEI